MTRNGFAASRSMDAVRILVLSAMAAAGAAGAEDPPPLVSIVANQVDVNHVAVGVETGDVEIEGLCILSEPSGVTLLCASLHRFRHSPEGREWLAEKIHGLPQAEFGPSTLRATQLSAVLFGGRRGDTRAVVWMFGTWEDGSRGERRLEVAPILAPIPQGPGPERGE